MSDALERRVIFREILGRSSTFTNHPAEIILRRINVYILEMEDVLFHHNSAVMMPSAPAGQSSQDGTEDDATDSSPFPGVDDTIRAGQESVAGIRALGLVFRQLEFAPDNKLIVVGHTDTSGQAGYNFTLSDERAQNVLYLLTGERDEWADVCYEKHKIEDYQQILKYMFTHPDRQWPCDPGDIDDAWGTDTRNATESFIEHYNREYADTQDPPAEHIPPDTLTIIERDGRKRWTREMWKAVYDLYSEDLGEFFEGGVADLASARQQLFDSDDNWVDPENRFLGCGESFPIDDAEKENYRSQSNRRVVILFFDPDEVPEITCPADRTSVHEEEDCPLWHGWHFMPLYIDSRDLNSVVYHLEFLYFNRIKDDRESVPDGLRIQAVENGTDRLPTISRWRDGVYHVKVQFRTPLDDGSHTSLHFEFQTNNQWAYTENDGADPELRTRTTAQINALSWEDRQKYYDLPVEWTSRNYFTRHSGNVADGDRFERVFNEILELKPVGEDTTEAAEPLVFNLDDIVLGNANRSQILRDQSPTGTDMNLDANSRYTLFFLDGSADPVVYKTITNYQEDEGKINIHNQDSNEPVFTDGAFTENLIHDVPGCTRMVYFCSNFYDVFDKRTQRSDPGFDLARNHVLGARLALRDDQELHVSKSVDARTEADRNNCYALDTCGHYVLHYFHKCGTYQDKMMACLFIYWSGRFRANHGGTAADVRNHRRLGMTNAMERLNKDLFFEKSTGPDEIDFFIRPFHFIEAKNDTNGGQHKALVDITDNTNGAWMRPTDGKLRRRDYRNNPTYFGNPDPDNNLADTDGQTYEVLTNQHEYGHATGCWDNYLYDYESNWRGSDRTWRQLPTYAERGQPFTAPGGPYSCDILARMNKNRTPRMRQFWKYVCWLHDEGRASGDLHGFLGGASFKVTFKGTKDGAEFTHNYEMRPEYKNVERSARRQENHRINANTRTDLYLYKLGDEELSHFTNLGNMSAGYESTQVFTGILVVRTKIALKFIDGSGSNNWGFNTALAWAQSLNDDMKHMLNGEFRIWCNDAANDFRSNYVFFVPHFSVYTGGAPGDSDFNVEVTFQRGGNFSGSGNTMEVDWDTDKRRIARYCYGRTTGTSNLTRVDFPTIVTWISGPAVANGTFVMSDL